VTTTEQITTYCEAEGYPFLPMTARYGHSCGVPSDYATVVDTERRVVDGTHAVYVYADRVVLMSLRYPTNYNDWQTVEAIAYSTTEELLAALKTLTKAKSAPCWGTAS